MDNNDFIHTLSMQHIPWLDGTLDEKIVLATRIRLTRNLEGFPFPIAATPEQSQVVTERITPAIKKSPFAKMRLIPIKSITALSCAILHERRLVGKRLPDEQGLMSLLLNEEECLSVIINEEDHLRIQCMKAGFELEKAWVTASTLLHEMKNTLTFCYDHELGFLTSCPSNVGTGLKASALLHLPGLQMISKLAPVLNGVQRLGISVRAITGDGQEHWGALFQISNQSTLGESELEILTRLETVIESVVHAEKVARQKLFLDNHFKLLNEVSRAYGLLKFAYALTLQEAFTSLSALRLGVDLKLFSTLTSSVINELFLSVQDAHILSHETQACSAQDLDILRAAHVRERIRQSSESA